MKIWLKSALSIFLGIMILVAGSGISIAKMICVKSGYTSITLYTPDECCKHTNRHAPVTVEEKCCDISSMHVEVLQYLNSAIQNIAKSVQSAEFLSTDFGVAAYSEVITSRFREHAVPPEISIPPLPIFTKSFLT